MSVLNAVVMFSTIWLMTMTPEVGISSATSSILRDPEEEELLEPVGLFSHAASNIPITARNKPNKIPHSTDAIVNMHKLDHMLYGIGHWLWSQG